MALYNPPPLLCHHCGTDYARQYWASAPSLEHPTRRQPDPLVCPSCCRDTNPDAADAPRWVPTAAVAEVVREQLVSPSRKQCRMCRGEWDGRIFGPPVPQGSPLPFGICPSCAGLEDSRAVPVVPMGVPTTLPRPARVFGYDD